MTNRSVGFLQATFTVLVLVGGCSGKGSPTIDAAAGGATSSGGISTNATSSASGCGSGGTSGLGGVSGTGDRDVSRPDGPIQCEYQGKLFDVGEGVAIGCNGCVCDASYRMFVCASTGCGLGSVSSTDGGECGDPVVKALYPSCRASTDAASCSAREGLWRSTGSNIGTCACPTGEGGCPCAASRDCLGHCVAWKDPFGSCDSTAGPFTCTSFGGILGCWCRPEAPSAVCYP